MKKISIDEYHSLIANTSILERDTLGAKVFLSQNNLIIKLFRKKKRLSKAIFYPYAKRFVNNIKILKKHDITTPDVINYYRVKEHNIDIVIYKPLEGNTVRSFYNTLTTKQFSFNLGVFFSLLHHNGIYFRSIHFGNIIYTGFSFGLIDVADLYKYKKPLSIRKRKRNFNHFLRYNQDRNWILKGDTYKNFIDGYLFSQEVINWDKADISNFFIKSSY